MEVGRHPESASETLEQVAHAHALVSDVVRLVIRVFAQVARERARKTNVLHPRQAGLPLVRLGRHQDRTAISDALDVGRDPERAISGAEDRGGADHRPWKVARAREHRLTPPLALAVVEGWRWGTVEWDEVLFPRRLAVKVWIDARRYEDVALAFEHSRDRGHLIG